MKVFFIGAGPGDPELLTLKAARIIGQCSVCLYAGSLAILTDAAHLLSDVAGFVISILAIIIGRREVSN